MLTPVLAARARRVETIEVDRGLVRALEATGLPANVRLDQAEAVAVDVSGVLAERGAPRRGAPASHARVAPPPPLPGLGAPARWVANLPYSVATPLLRRFLDLAEGV